MSHLSPTRMADFAAGTLKESLRGPAETHLQSCEACERALARIVEAREAMAELREEPAPELAWESIAARVYWSTSSEARAKERASQDSMSPPLWRRPVFAATAVASVAAIAALSLWGLSGEEKEAETPYLVSVSPEAGSPQIPLNPAQALGVTAVADSLSGLITFAQGELLVGGQLLRPEQEIVAGNRLRADEGGLVVQFGDKSAFRLAPHSSLDIRRFDEKRIELSVVGTVDIDLTARLAGQEFVVVAGDHEVLVRGTAFRVDFRDDELEVSCTRGKVVVSGNKGMVAVPAGHALQIVQDALRSTALEAEPIDPQRLQALDKAMVMPMLPAWSERRHLMDTTTLLEVSAAAGQGVAVDGVPVADGSFLLRTMSGRHQVALVDEAGELVDEEWVAMNARERKQLRLVAPESVTRVDRASKGGDQKVRRDQLRLALDRSERTTRCLAPLAKKGLKAGSFVVFDVGINADGSQGYLNLRKSNLSPIIVDCVRRAIDAEELPSGPATGFRLDLRF